MAAWILALAVVAVLYPYVLYPCLLAIAARRRPDPAPEPEPEPSQWPPVAILVSAFNEESRIADKLANFQALRYPGRLEMWIGVDGATDRTAALIAGARLPGVELEVHAERRGKTTVLNQLARRARAAGAEVLIFTDVNAFFRPDAIGQLTRELARPGTGLVSGRTVIRGQDGNAETEGAYYRLESWLKEREGSLGLLPGADGAIYALRAELYTELAPALINDLAHPCQVVAQGYAARFAPDAVSEESAGEGAEREFHRQTRMTAQAAYVLAVTAPPLLSRGRWGMLAVLASHKWSRWMAGLWLVLGALAWTAATGPGGLAALALAGTLLAVGWRRQWPGAGLLVFFVLVHAAYLRGLGKALQGERYVTWKPRAG